MQFPMAAYRLNCLKAGGHLGFKAEDLDAGVEENQKF